MRIKNEMEHSAIPWFQNMVRTFIELIFRIINGDKTFYETENLDWVKDFEQHTKQIKEEYLNLVVQDIDIPDWQSLSDDPNVQVGTDWKTFVLKAYDKLVEKNSELCPVTTQLITKYPFVLTTWFSVLEAGKSLPFHRGPYNGVLRYHLGLIIPGDGMMCSIQVGDDVAHWNEGKSLLFDDSHMHAVWNKSTERRVVLFVDIERPLPFPFNYLNKFIIRMIGNSEYVLNIIKNANQ